MDQIQKEPETLDDLQQSYDRLYQDWMGAHQNIEQANRMLNLLDVQPGGRLADIGCGTGYVLDMAASRGLRPFGVDISMVALRQAQQSNQNTNLLMAAGENLPWPADAFDYVIILGSLEHFLNPGIAIQEVARILRPEGRAAILVPNSHHLRAIYNVYKFGELLSDFQDYERFATRKEWERLLKTNGLEIHTVHKWDTGMSRLHKQGREFFWYVYNIMFKLFKNHWIPLNLTYTFIFICQPHKGDSGLSINQSTK